MTAKELISQELILDSLTEGVFTVDQDLNVLTFNQAAEEITGVARDQAVGAKCYEVFRANVCEADCALNASIVTGESTLDKTVDILDARGRKKPISIRTSILCDKRGEVVGGVETFRDLSTETALRKELTGQYTFGDIGRPFGGDAVHLRHPCPTCPSRRPRSSSKGSPGPARSSSPGPSTTCPPGPGGPFWP